ncbi:hypothetical protein A3J19_03120 [Candidatus Daviesbacteria bacterium RIFCSPLOWO2_02_FULL_41_8]|uniref:GGDEF domain-containing protein n=3 Tax=Candidatus Daviesiibacteriota TaxID=1752718 RepID=A0A1F5NIS3_9BACT|nr:MAG: hypothetical protein A2871_01875 [Candidatus Daviesbacteria bacterium RIFCSPHIGHO2_01_FULL_41_23]OGE33086.1 MAG: hypothetical protein A3D83_02975 [Candidatus Daviesbacteria bacterium RIFCSPHIGHO2_02_FULL_41_10]OGE77569.1 MAG: hypothetical protein A3J19_03120 [Candidatus Daviesbacteria bacterium RIFCSPLOWO2_02_FULL_41_8]
MPDPSRPETGHIHQPDIATREDRIQAKTTEIKELYDLLGPIGRDRTIAEREAALEEDRAELEEDNAELEQKAALHGKDGLTGLDDRYRFDEGLNREIQSAIRTGQKVSAFFADINNLKPVNDQYGHIAGDQVIKAVADVLSKRLRSTDCVYRYGGDEFAVLLPETDKASAAEVALRLLEGIKNLEVEIAEGQKINIDVALGVDTFKPDQKKPQKKVPPNAVKQYEKKLVDGADHAMYESKRRGDRKVVVAIDSEAEKFEIGQFLTQKGLSTADVVPVNRGQLPKATSLPKLPA